MENRRSNISIFFRVIGLLFVLASIACCIVVLVQNHRDILYIFKIVTLLLANFLGLIYIARGCTKRDAKVLKAFIIMLAINSFLAVIDDAFFYQVPLRLVTVVVTFGSVVILAAGKDLGPMRSFIYAGLFFLSNVVYALITVANKEYSTIFTVTSARILSSVLLIILIFFKYTDKFERNTK